MSGLVPNEVKGVFGGGGGPSPQYVPVSPANDAASAQARDDAARAAIAERKAAGRTSTAAAGQSMAEEDQLGRGKQRQAARTLLG